MPLSPASAQATFKVMAVMVTLSVNRTEFRPGDTITFSGLVTADGEPVSGVKCYIQLNHPSKGWTDFVDADVVGGAFTRSVACPWSWEGVAFPCRTWRARARCLGAYSSEKSFTVYYPTRIRGLTVSPSTVLPGDYVHVSGYLEKQVSATAWQPIATKQVNIYLDTTLKGSPYTGSDGRFSLSFPAPSRSGTYTVKAQFPGEALTHASPASAEALLTVGVAPPGIAGLLSLVPPMVVAGVIAYNEARARGWIR